MTMRTGRSTNRRLAAAWLLAAALVLAQGVGLLHRVLHAPGQPDRTAVFGQHTGGDCLLFDQLAAGDTMAVAPPAAPHAAEPPGAPPDTVLAGRAAAVATVYLARAPPPAG